MTATVYDAEILPEEAESLSPKLAATILILLISLALFGLGGYWLSIGRAAEAPPAAEAPAPVVEPAQPAPAAAPPAAEPAQEELISAPMPTCIDGKPASPDVPADSCA